ncbi:MAG: hypothetical protein JW748_12365 [Anaerolineales bacterium]|nr:hypothetical protein [Anaerolineales bacterium]
MKTSASKRLILGPAAALAVLMAAQLACSFGGDAAGNAAEATTPKAGETAAAAAAEAQPEATAQPAAGSGGGGFACFGTVFHGVTCLTDAGWKTYTDDNSELESDYIEDLAACPDGKIYAATSYGITSFDGKEWDEITMAEGQYSASQVACAPDGSVWFGYYEGVGRYQDDAWESFASDEFDTGEYSGLIYGLEIAPDGTVWVLTASSIAKYDGASWTEYKEGLPFEDSSGLEALAVDSKGRVWVTSYTEIYMLENGEWTKYEFEDFLSIRSLVVDPQDRIWVNADEGAAIFDGSDWEFLSYSNRQIHSTGVQTAAFDAAGRTWLGMLYGIDILTGDTWTHYRMDNSGLVDNEIQSIAVVGNGPALPEPLTKEPGSLVGSVSMGGSVLANVRIEVCVESLELFFQGDTPCSEQPFLKGVETDAEGKFSFPDLPEGYYVITIQTGDSWAQLGDLTSERILVEAGKETDLGELEVEED